VELVWRWRLTTVIDSVDAYPPFDAVNFWAWDLPGP
jgi:hypothetical protein